MTTLYKLYNAAGRCLYIGISDHPERRFAQHREKAWWPDVATKRLAHFGSREEAAAAESAAILKESPMYNRTHNKGRGQDAHARKDARRLVSIATAADHLGVHTVTIRRRIADGTLTGYRMGPRLIRVDLNEIESKFLQTIPTAWVSA